MTIINTQITGSGSPTPPTEKYPVGKIFYENGDYKGIVYGHFTDENNIRYALILELYRNTDYNEVIPKTPSGYYCDNSITSITVKNTPNNDLYKDYDTATKKCNAIMTYCADNNYTSVVQTIRQESITLDGITYYGQMPTVNEYLEMLRHSREIAAIADEQGVVGKDAWKLAQYWSKHMSSNRTDNYFWSVGSSQAGSSIQRNAITNSGRSYIIFEVPAD